MVIFWILILIQLILNLIVGYWFGITQIRYFKIIAIILFPLAMIVWPILSALRYIDLSDNISVAGLERWGICIVAIFLFQILCNWLLLKKGNILKYGKVSRQH
jgi:hypothetical protein